MTYPTKKLGEVCEINMGQSPSSSTYNIDRDGTPFYQGKKDYGEKYPTPRVWCSKPVKVVDEGDILISVRAPVGALNIASEKSCIGRGLAGLRAKEKLDQNFLFHFLKLKEKEIAALGTGTTFTAISKKDLENLQIPLPTIAEQRKIVVKLEAVLGKIKEAKKLRAKAEAAAGSLLAAELHKIFEEGKTSGWEEKELGVITGVVTGSTPKTSVKDYYGNRYLWARPGDLNEGLVISTEKKLSEKGFKAGGVRVIPQGSVMVCCIGSIGKIGIASEKMATNQQINSFIPIASKIGPRFLFYSLVNIRERFIENASSTILQIINKSRCEKLKIPLPPITEQKKIVARLDALANKISSLRAAQSETASALSTLEQSVLHKAFA